ncbi:MAG: hypothetical protein KBC96_13530 [Armatimonadetes bacterium]|nr:hypothetical protein [Armatimonadota bacterium]
MLLRVMIAVGCIGLTAACGIPAAAKSETRWKIGEPIVTYWAGPGSGDFMALDDRAAAQLAAGGWNLGWASKPEDLDVYHRHGLRAMLVVGTPNIDDPDKAKALDALIERVKDHPSLYAYYVTDEPGAGSFAGLGKLVAFLRQRDPAHLPFINLYPTYANAAQLGVSDDAAERAKVGYPTNFAGIGTDNGTVLRYREHLRQFVDTVKPDLISYDHYHFLKNGDGAQYFLNIAMIRQAAMEAGKPFMNIIQTCDSPAEGWRGPNENELRWLTYTSLAYGAQAIAHFRYDIGLWENPKDPTTPLPLYWALCRINRDFTAIARKLQPLKSLGAYHCGTLPLGGQPPPKGAPFLPSPASQEILIGYFGRSARRATHAVVVNLDYRKPASTTIAAPGPMDVFDAPTESWSGNSGGARLHLDLPPGGGALVRLRR